MDRSRMRSAAISCVIACGAMVAGPGALGSAVASADGLFGVDVDVLDIFGHHNKSDHVGVVVGVGQPQLGGGVNGGVAGRAPNPVARAHRAEYS